MTFKIINGKMVHTMSEEEKEMEKKEMDEFYKRRAPKSGKSNVGDLCPRCKTYCYGDCDS